MAVSFSGNNDTFMIQIGDSGGIETSGYTSAVAYTGGGTSNNGDKLATLAQQIMVDLYLF